MSNSTGDTRRWRRIVLGYLLVLAVADIVGYGWRAPAGAVCHGAVLLVLLNHYVVAMSTGPVITGDSMSRADYHLSTLPVLGLVPTLRIASLAVPNNEVSPIFWYGLISLALASAVVLTARLNDARGAELGLRWTPQQRTIALIGVPLALVAWELPQPSPLIEGDNPFYVLVGSVVLLLLGGLEEVVFRGMIQRSLCRLFGISGIFFAAGLSTAAASGSDSLSFVAFSGGVTLVFGWFVHRTGSVIGVALAHGIVNMTAIVLLPSVS
ncbi:MAG: CPBP family intramembrane metalloprotease [Actinomycetota bacterium]|nr:CPBP family intramembrane metalloprotease [Actinomycetota bacterium]